MPNYIKQLIVFQNKLYYGSYEEKRELLQNQKDIIYIIDGILEEGNTKSKLYILASKINKKLDKGLNVSIKTFEQFTKLLKKTKKNVLDQKEYLESIGIKLRVSRWIRRLFTIVIIVVIAVVVAYIVYKVATIGAPLYAVIGSAAVLTGVGGYLSYLITEGF
jgi:hypothetical protein